MNTKSRMPMVLRILIADAQRVPNAMILGWLNRHAVNIR